MPAHAIQDSCFLQANALHRNGFPDEALTEYLRYIYWQPTGELRSLCMARSALCHRSFGRLNEALDICLAGNRENPSAYLKDEFRLEAAELYLDMRQAGLADFTAEEILESCDNTGHRAQAFSIRTRAALARGHFEESVSAAMALLEEMQKSGRMDAADAAHWHALLEDVTFKSPSRAMTFSAIVPGGGQLYAGKPGRSLNALLANGTLGFICAGAIAAGDVGAGVFSFSLLRRFYLGNRLNAARSCHDHNRTLIEPLLDCILSVTEEAIRRDRWLFETPALHVELSQP